MTLLETLQKRPLCRDIHALKELSYALVTEEPQSGDSVLVKKSTLMAIRKLYGVGETGLKKAEEVT